MSFTQTIVLGRLVADPEVHGYGNEGKELVRFRIAANISKDTSAFYNCVAFDQTGQIIKKYAGKGKQVQIVGQMRNSDYDKDVNGTTVRMYGYELNVNNVTLLGDAQPGQGGNQGQQRPQAQQNQQQGGFQQGSFQQNQAPAQGGFQQNQQNQAPAAGGFSGFGGVNISNDDLPF